MVDAVMVEIACLHGGICPEHIRVNDAAKPDTLLGDGHERFRSRIGDYGRITFPLWFSPPKTAIFAAAPGHAYPIPLRQRSFIGFSFP